MNTNKIFLFLLVLSSTIAAQAQEIRYEISNLAPASCMIQFSIPYTFGVHQGQANSLTGHAVTGTNDQVIAARFRVPIESITTGNFQRDCHLREAFGINYGGSRFPNEHVCDESNRLPISGPDAIQYPYISVEFLGMSLPSEPLVIGTPQNFNIRYRLPILQPTAHFGFFATSRPMPNEFQKIVFEKTSLSGSIKWRRSLLPTLLRLTN